MTTPLDNPLWSSLTGLHANFAQGGDALRLYPWEMVPFAAVPNSDVVLRDSELDALIGPRPYIYFVGTLPRLEATHFEAQPLPEIVQMVWSAPASEREAAIDVRQLSERDVPAMLELTQRVYPAYFRERTIEMGPYLGAFDQGELVAMAGLRMAPEGFRELSGVCTDQRYAGRGLAAALCSQLSRRVRDAGMCPMLHFDADNVRARHLYEKLGFTVRRMMPMCRVKRR